ncbi:uncharacterized protein LOC119305703 [Triticum dicoccoides]|uniref:uncharacterized protein LOC119305703 n=1 Tax=Triticum dicoccoides TaxID=85692 RepID=UPI00188ECC16|nr:uncharacterized protein LOC119305703 [Triticum dicoccoides]
MLFSVSPPRCRRAHPPPPPLPTFYRVAALSSPTFGGLAALLSSFPWRRIEFKLGPLSSSRRRIPSMRGLHRRQAPGAGGRELQGRPHPLSLPDPPRSSLARRDADAMEDAAPPLLRSAPPVLWRTPLHPCSSLRVWNMKLAMPRMNKMRALTVPLVNCFWAQSQRKDSLPSAALGFRLRRGKRISKHCCTERRECAPNVQRVGVLASILNNIIIQYSSIIIQYSRRHSASSIQCSIQHPVSTPASNREAFRNWGRGGEYQQQQQRRGRARPSKQDQRGEEDPGLGGEVEQGQRGDEHPGPERRRRPSVGDGGQNCPRRRRPRWTKSRTQSLILCFSARFRGR